MAAPTVHRVDAAPAAPTAPAAGRPLTAFEQLMLVDDRPGHPLRFFLETLVSGPLQESRFRAAVETAARRHPLLCSRVVVRRGQPRWLAPDVLPTVVWEPSKAGDDLWRPSDLQRESGARIVVLDDGSSRHRVVFQIHHAVCDGVAGCEFMGDIWAAYAGIEPRAFSHPRPPRPGPGAAPTADPSTESPAAGTDQNAIRDPIREAWSFARFWPTPLAVCGKSSPWPSRPRNGAKPSGTKSPADPRSPPYGWLDFDQAATERLRTAASAAGVSLNDVLVAAAMRAAVAWNASVGRRHGNVRVTMPVNLRPPGQREPARNQLGYAFLDRTAAECAAARPLMSSIAAATHWILDHGAATFFLDAIAVLARRPWLLRLVTRMPVCISTVVVSNVGDPSRRMRSGVPRVNGRDAPADLVIESCVGVPPLRPRTRAAIGVTTYAGGLTLCCLCSAHPDPHEAARRFLEFVRQELDEMASPGVASSGPSSIGSAKRERFDRET